MRRPLFSLISLLTLAMALVSSCIDMPEMDEFKKKLKNGEIEWNPDKSNTQLKTCLIDNVTLNGATIRAAENEDVVSDIRFFLSDSTYYVGSTNHYKLESDKFSLHLTGVAAKAEVDGIMQTDLYAENVDFSKDVQVRLYASDGQYKEYTLHLVKGPYTGFPVVSITKDAVQQTGSSAKWTSGVIKISGQDSEFASKSFNALYRVRGHNSATYAKKSYTIKLPERTKVLGMQKHKKWLLIANAGDRTLLRNRVAYEISSRTGLAWTPSSEYCEVIVNGSYAGLYMMVEQIKIDKNRLNIHEITAENASTDITGGYLLECDRYPEEVSFKTAIRELPINIKSPAEDVITQAHIDYISNYLKKIEQLLYSRETPDPEYREYVDLESFADVWIVLELTHCREARLPGSIWYYKDKDGKLCAGPVWDFDVTTFTNSVNFMLYDYEVTDFTETNRSLWYSRMFLDPEFKRIVKERWNMYYQSFATIPEYIDEQAAIIENSANVNFSIWTKLSGSNTDKDLAWKDAVDLMKVNYKNRLQAMDDKINEW